MSRTPEQRAADDALTEAIEGVIRAYIDQDGDNPGLLTDYVVTGAREGIDEDGERYCSVVSFTRDDSVPSHTQIGLLDTRLSWLRSQLRSTYADDDE